jgi:hypothetical protein
MRRVFGRLFLGGCFENGTLHPAGVAFFHMAFYFLLKRK